MNRKTILATMTGLALAGAIAAGPASAQQYQGNDPHYPGNAHISGHHGVSEHDHYAAWVTQQRKLRAQHQRWAEHQQQGGGPGYNGGHDGNH